MADQTGLFAKYNITKANGESLPDEFEGFVLRLDFQGDINHVNACRHAVQKYADKIEPYIPELASDIRSQWPVLAEGPLKASLSSSQERFAQWVQENTPYLLHLFNFEERAFIPERAEEYLSVASRGEAIMARFVLGVWRTNDEFDFDFTEAAAHLDQNQMGIVTDWLRNPFWP